MDKNHLQKCVWPARGSHPEWRKQLAWRRVFLIRQTGFSPRWSTLACFGGRFVTETTVILVSSGQDLVPILCCKQAGLLNVRMSPNSSRSNLVNQGNRVIDEILSSGFRGWFLEPVFLLSLSFHRSGHELWPCTDYKEMRAATQRFLWKFVRL